MAKDAFTEEDHRQVLAALKEAEKNTSGEIRLFVEKVCKGEVLDRAAFLFGQLNMHKTELRNGVLIYLALTSHKFAVIGDAGINARVPATFWDNIKDVMQRQFAAGQFVAGLTEGIRMSGKALQDYFPYSSGDSNELSDEIVFGQD